MGVLKRKGGITRGRGITSSTQATFIHAMPKTIPVCSALQDFSGVKTTSEQHVDMRVISQKRDTANIILFLNYLRSHSPFSYTNEHQSSLVCIATGVVAAETANADQAEDRGQKAATTIENHNYADVKLKSKDKVVSISASHNSIQVRGESVVVNPTLLFLRITCVIKDSEEMKKYLRYEFGRQGPCLFKDNEMRKNQKSELATKLKQLTQSCLASNLENRFYVLDGGHLLHNFIWPSDKNMTYDELCIKIVSHVKQFYVSNVIVVFDGYRNPLATKTATQKQRAEKHTSSNIIFSANDKLSCDQTSFLTNSFNKARLIDMLMIEFQNAEIECHQCLDDADYMVVNKTINTATENPNHSVMTVANDTDILVLLIHHTNSDNVFMHYSVDEVYSISRLQSQLPPQVKHHILVLHAVSGCDTVSAIFNIGKSTAYTAFTQDINLDFLNIFQSENAIQEDISQAGEKLLLTLFKSKKCTSLDKLRYIRYVAKVTTKSITSSLFGLESLPPTSNSAKYHSFRVYHTVQQWLGCMHNAFQWGWQRINGRIKPIPMDIPVAPENILKIISCGCKVCGKGCKCRRSDLFCTHMCSTCNGQTCSNKELVTED